MKRIINKIREKEGFTLAELLIVVAIIAVLVAISIPVFTTKLESSREAVDLSNMRAAYAEAQSEALVDSTFSGAKYYLKSGGFADSSSGAVQGKGTTADGHSSPDWDSSVFTYSTTADYTAKYIKVTIADHKVTKVEFAD